MNKFVLALVLTSIFLSYIPEIGYATPRVICDPVTGIVKIDLPNTRANFSPFGKTDNGDSLIWLSSVSGNIGELAKITFNKNKITRLLIGDIGADEGNFYIRRNSGETEYISSLLFYPAQGVEIMSDGNFRMCGYVPPMEQAEQKNAFSAAKKPESATAKALGTTTQKYRGNASVKVTYPSGYKLSYTIPSILTIGPPLKIKLLNINDNNKVYLGLEAYPPGSMELSPGFGKFKIDTSTTIGPGNISANKMFQFWDARVSGTTIGGILINRHTETGGTIFTNYIWLPDIVFGNLSKNRVRIRFYEGSTMKVTASSSSAKVNITGSITQATLDPNTYAQVPLALKVTIDISLTKTN